MAIDPKHIVRSGYDAASYFYRSDRDILPGDPQPEATLHYHQWLDQLEPLLRAGSRVLELGCGCGLPVARRLASNYTYTGVDISPVQIERARGYLHASTFICADMTELSFAPASFDAILAFFSIIHVPLEEQPALYRQIAAWLLPGGLLMVTLPLSAWTGTEEDWHGSGATMYWSHADTDTYLDWLAELDFRVIWSTFLPEGGDGFNLVLAKKAPQSAG